jgi:hypothetical protein
VDTAGRSADPRGASARILDTAEGVVVALRGCSLNQAFVEIAQTAKAHNMSVSSLADALVAIAQNQAPKNVDDDTIMAARTRWGHLLRRNSPSRAIRSTPERLDEKDVVPGA